MNGASRRLAAPLALLLLFIVVIRVWPALVRPALPPDDCERVESADMPALERCVALRPGDIELMLDLAGAYERARQPDRAAGIYARALSIDPYDAEVRTRLEALRRTPPSGRP